MDRPCRSYFVAFGRMAFFPDVLLEGKEIRVKRPRSKHTQMNVVAGADLILFRLVSNDAHPKVASSTELRRGGKRLGRLSDRAAQ